MNERTRELEQSEFMLAQLAACTANFSMCRPKEPFSTKDFMPSQWGKSAEETTVKRKRRNRAKTAVEVRSVFQVLIARQNG